jgi:hypothetical protein
VVYRQVVTTFANKMKQKDATVFFVEEEERSERKTRLECECNGRDFGRIGKLG